MREGRRRPLVDDELHDSPADLQWIGSISCAFPTTAKYLLTSRHRMRRSCPSRGSGFGASSSRQNLDVVASTGNVQSLAALQTPGSPYQGLILSLGSSVTGALAFGHGGRSSLLTPAADPENSP